LLTRLRDLLGLNADGWDESVLRFIERQEGDGLPLEIFARWCKEDVYNAPKTHQIAQSKGRLIRATWPAAFAAYQEATESSVPVIY
jgi:hypothetical protein